MRATRNNILLILILIILSNCKGLYQNDFLFDKELIRPDSSIVIAYKLYQTGIDNYRYEFYGISGNDSIKLFDAFLNDATYKTAKFHTDLRNDSVFIDCSMNIGSKTTRFNDLVVYLNQTE